MPLSEEALQRLEQFKRDLLAREPKTPQIVRHPVEHDYLHEVFLVGMDDDGTPPKASNP